MTMITQNKPFTAASKAAPQSKQPLRFGRDAIFERNDRFDSVTPRCQQEEAKLTDLLNQPAPKKKEALAVARQLASLSEFLFTQTGRVRGKVLLPLAREAAEKEYELFGASKDATPTEKSLAAMKLGNVLIAEDKDNNRGITLIDEAYAKLKKANLKPEAGKAPAPYIHALYNMGTYFMNNDLYSETVYNLGPKQQLVADANHEGLTLDLRGSMLRYDAPGYLMDGLPFIDQAIALARGVEDKKMAQAEYLTAKGEMLHFLSHLDTFNPRWNEDSLGAFNEALRALQSVPPVESSPQHLKLAERLGETKIPHMCGHRHGSYRTTPQCDSADVNFRQLRSDLLGAGITPPPKTEGEQKAEEDAANTANQPMMDPLMMFLLAMGRRRG